MPGTDKPQGVSINFASNRLLLMRTLLLCLLSLISACTLAQQSNHFPQLDKSPLDMSYYPANYPILKIQPNKLIDSLVARVIYSRPQKLGRKVFEELVKKGEIWRLGANEATEIEFFRDVRIGNKRIKKGRYTLYAIEQETNWTLILNTELDVWGSFRYNTKKDVVRVDCPITRTTDITEAFTMIFEKKTDKSFDLVMAWDDQQVALPISW